MLTRGQAKSKKSQHRANLPSAAKPSKKPIQKMLKLSKRMLRIRMRERCLRQQKMKPAKIQALNMQQIQELSHSQKLNCPICLQIFVYPIVTQCGHIFCLSCAQQSLKHKGSCSLCRSDVSLQEFKPEKLLLQLLELKIKKEADRQTIENYNRRVKQFELEESRRKVQQQIKVGDYVDYWKERTWKGGKVMEVATDAKGEKIIKVQSQRPHNQAQVMEFALNSRLIAKHRAFSKESDNMIRCWPEIRIDIFDIRDSFSPLFWNEPLIGRRIHAPSVRLPFFRPQVVRAGERRADNRIIVSDQDDSQSLIRFTFSFQRPQN